MVVSTPYRQSYWSRRDWVDTMRREMGDYRKDVGLRLRELRQSRQASQESAAHIAGVSTTTWRNWERGLRAPYERNWRKIAEGFKLSDDDVGAIRGQTPQPLGLGNGSDDQFAEILTLLHSMNDRLADVEKMLLQRETADLQAEAEEQTRRRRKPPDTGEAETS